MSRIANTRIYSFRSVPQTKDEDNPGAPSQEFLELDARWELIVDLLGGTDAMRDKGERWLPREPGEPVNNYRVRLSRTFLYNGFRDTVDGLVAKPMSKPVSLSGLGDTGKLPGQLEGMEDDMDGSGRDLTAVAREMFEHMCAFGKCHAIVDYPTTQEAANLGQERAMGLRPIVIPVHPRDVIGWRGYVSEDGSEQLTQVRIKEITTEPRGKYGTRKVQRVRVINAPETPGAMGTWQVFRMADDGTYGPTPESEGTHTFDGVPLVTAYAKRRGLLKCEVPLQDLAEMNLCHWQSSSDQRNCLRFSRIGLIAATGLTPDEADKPIIVSPSSVLKSSNPTAKFYYVEHSGSAIGAGQTDIEHLEKRMEVLGMKPLVEYSAQSTATGKAIDENRNQTLIQSWIRDLERALEQALDFAAEWVKVELPEDFAVDILSDFVTPKSGATDGPLLVQARAAGDITRETFIAEFRRRGIISDDVDPAAEAEAAAAEAPAGLPPMQGNRGGFGGPGGPGGPPGATLPGQDPSKPPFPPPGGPQKA